MRLPDELNVVIKVLGFGRVQEHTVSVGSYCELDTWLVNNVEESGRYEVFRAGSTQPLTAKEFEQLERSVSADDFSSVVLHVRPQTGMAPPVCGPARPAPPREVRVKQAVDGGIPEVSWKGNDDGSVAYYEVSIIDENYGPQRCDDVIELQQVPVPAAGRDPHFLMHRLHPDSVHRVEVTAVSESGTSGRPQRARFYAQRKIDPLSERAATELRQAGDPLGELCSEFSTQMGRDPLFLILGKQHHGKSSLVNHLVRCLTQRMDISDVVVAAPPSKEETTIRSKPVPVDFRQHELTFCDMPAFSSMNKDRKRDLNNLLWRVGSNWARGEDSWWPASNPPDAAIIVVSLMSWRDECESLTDYLRELQAVLKSERTTNRAVVFPFVVAVTHRDMFLEEEGNAGRDPIEELEKAENQLKRMANTENVFILSNYKASAWWVPAVTDSTYRMLCQVTTLAKNRTRSAWENLFSHSNVCKAVAVCTAAVIVGGFWASAKHA